MREVVAGPPPLAAVESDATAVERLLSRHRATGDAAYRDKAIVRAGLEARERRGAAGTVANLAVETGMSEDEVLEAMEGYHGRLAVSLHASPAGRVEDDDALVDHLSNSDNGYDKVIDLAALAPALSELDPRDREILSLRFGHELSQREIGEQIGVSQMHVSRLLRNVCERLRTTLIDA